MAGTSPAMTNTRVIFERRWYYTRASVMPANAGIQSSL
jgi:hypothetical protein